MFYSLRKPLILILIVAFVAATIVNVLSSFSSPSLLLVNAFLAFISVIQGVQWFREFGPERRSRTVEKISANLSVEEAERRYLEGRRAAFAAEQQLFVKTALTTSIQPQYSTQAETQKQTFDDIEQAVKLHHGRFVLIGDPGAGKSTALRHLMTQAITAYLDKRDNRLPVWINLGLSSNPVNADDLLNHWWHEQCYLPGDPKQYLRQGNVRLFFDGLNEMPEAGGSRKDRAAALRSFIDAHPALPIVVTCRVRDYQDDHDLKLGSPKPEDFPVVTVQPLDDTRIQEFISKRGANEKLWPAIQASDALLRLASNPYNLVMLTEIYKESGHLPENLNELYRHYVRLTYSHYNAERSKRKDGDPNTELLRLKLPELERRLKRLAFLMIARGKGTAAKYDWAQRQIGRTALRDGLNLGVLVHDDVNIRFYHQSLHSYFAAEPLSTVLKAKGPFGRVMTRIQLIVEIGNLNEASTPAVEPLIGALHDKDWAVRSSAASALGKIADPRAIEPLIVALRDVQSYVRRRAVSALGKIADPRAIKPLLIAVLHDPDESVRENAAEALAKIGDPHAIEPLIGLLSDTTQLISRRPVRFIDSYATAALGKIGQLAVEPLIVVLMTDSNKNVRCNAAEALGEIGDLRAVEPLIFALHDPVWRVRSYAAKALQRIGTPEALAAVEAWRREQGAGSAQ
jgi:hypothetical protein